MVLVGEVDCIRIIGVFGWVFFLVDLVFFFVFVYLFVKTDNYICFLFVSEGR